MRVYENVPAQFPPNAALDLMPLPGESIVSSLWRFAWRNGLSAKELLRFCSSGKTYPRENGRKSSLRGFDPEIFYEASWWIESLKEKELVDAGHDESRLLWWSRTLRYCPVCLEHLYHSYWHQSEFLSHCPIDGAELRINCYCCGVLLPTYGFYRNVLDKPYICSKCRGPISGINMSLEARLAMQQRKAGLKRIFDGLERWWMASSVARQEIESLPVSNNPRYVPWMRPDRSMRQWVLAMIPPPVSLPVVTATVPPLVMLKWKVRLKPDDPSSFVLLARKSKFNRLRIATQVYRATLRRLLKAISRCAPFDEAQYRRHMILPVEDHLMYPRQCNMMLLALIMLRDSYETYFSTNHKPPGEAVLQESNVGFPYGNDFAERVRICWRAQFIAEYVAFYWWLMAKRDGRKGVNEFRRASAALINIDVSHDRTNGDVIWGQAAFPAIDGLTLDFFP